MLANQNFSMHAGDTNVLSFQVAMPEGASLVGSQVEFWLARYASMFPSGGERLKSTTDPATANDILIVDADTVEILLRSSDTTGRSGPYHHLTRVTVNDEVRTIATGTVTFKQAPPVAATVAPLQLTALTLDPATVVEASPAGTLVGTLQGRTAGSTLSLINTAGGRLVLNGPTGAITAGLIPTDWETAASHDILVRETLAGASNSPRDTTVTVTVTNLPEVVIAMPTLSAATVAENAAPGTVVGSFGNLTPGISGELTDTAGGRFALSSYQLVTTAVGFDYEVAPSHQVVLTLTHPDAAAVSTPFLITVSNVAEPSDVLNDLVLISGHSLTDEPLPQMLRRLNEAATGTSVVRLSTVPGSSLAWRRDSGETTYPFNAWAELEGADDIRHLIMTEAGPIEASTVMAQPGGTYDAAWDWYRQAVDHNDDPEITLYEIWLAIDLDGNRVNTGTVDLARWRGLLVGDQERWDGIVAHLNGRKGPTEPIVRLLPVGRAWGRLYDEHMNLTNGLPSIAKTDADFAAAFFIDTIHWTPSSDPGVTGETSYGAYFVACCFYAHAYRQSPAGLPRALNDQSGNPYPLPPSPPLAAVLQAIAWEVVSTEPLADLNVPSAPVLSYVGMHPPPVEGSPVDALFYLTGSPRPTVSYEWLLDGAPISGATTSSYTPAAADVGKDLAVRVYDPESGVTRTGLSQEVTSPIPSVSDVWKGAHWSEDPGSGGGTNTTTWQVDIGPAAADRVIVVSLAHQNYNYPFTLTIGGVSLPARATVAIDGSTSRQLFSGLVPALSGPQPAVLSAPGSAYSDRWIGVWVLHGVDPVPKQIVLNQNISNIAIPVEAGDVLLAQASALESASPNTFDFANATEVPDGQRFTPPGFFFRMSYAEWSIDAAAASFAIQPVPPSPGSNTTWLAATFGV